LPIIDILAGKPSTANPGVELATVKAAVEPVWFLPGVAERFGMYGTLLFLESPHMYLLTL
jgi:hypothetical protein